MKTKLFTLFLALAASVGTIFAESGTCGTNLTWNFADSVMTISGTGAMKNYDINSSPSPWNSFRSSIKRIVIQEGVTSVGKWAFFGCDNLVAVTLPEGLITIGICSFQNCGHLPSIYIPASVKTIGDMAFDRCPELKSVYISDIAAWCKISFQEYGNPIMGADLYVDGNIVEDLTIPSSVTNIGKWCFRRCTSLKSVTIPSTVTNVGNFIFYDCSNLISVTIESGVKTIGNGTFIECSNLTTVNLPNSLTAMGNRVFADCSSLTSLILPNSLTSIGYSAFLNCSSMISIKIPDGITKIENYTFSGCTNLETLNVHDNITSIGIGAFENCSKLTYIYIPNKVTKIEDYTFSGCHNLTSITIPGSVTSIGNSAFCECSSLETLTIPNNVTSIGDNAFVRCIGLKSIDIPSNVTTIGSSAFYNCTGLTTLTIGNSVTNIGNQVFYGCSNLSSIYFNGTLTEWCESIIPPCLMSGWAGGNLYLQNSLLTQATINYGITEIKDYTFSKCTSLASVFIPESVIRIGKYVFANCSNLGTIDIPKSVTKIEANSFSNCTSLDSLSIHCKLDSVVNSAFSSCKNIRYLGICLTDSAPSIKKLFSGSLTKSVKEIELFPGSTCCGTPVDGNNHLPFMGNASVEKITIPANIALIPDSSFMNCKKLKELSFGLTEASEGANISRRVVSEYKDGVHIDGEYWDYVTHETEIKNKICGGCEKLESIYFGKGVTIIGNGVCEGCSTLTKIYLDPNVKTIGQSAFAGCGLTSVTIPSSVTGLGYLAFENNPHLINVDMKCSTLACQEQGGAYGQFANCPNIETVKIKMEKDMSPNERTPKLAGITGIFGSGSIGNWKTLEFYEGSTLADVGDGENTSDMPNLETLRLANSIIEITNYSFAGVFKLRNVTLPSSLKVIGCGVFTKSGLKKISISEGVQEIPGEFCMGSEELEKVTFGSQISNIRFCAFQNCKKLKQIHTNRITPPEIDDYTFCYSDGVNKKDITVHVPKKAVDNYVYDSNNPSWSDFYICSGNDIQSVTLPSNTPQTEVQKTAASVSVPSIPSATYGTFTVTNKKDNSTRETEFTGWGSGFDFAPRRGLSHVNEESTGVQGLKFTMRELAPNTTYDYSIALYDIDENLLAEYTGSFTTLEDTETALDQTNEEMNKCGNEKILRNGQILILRGEKVYTLQGQEVK